MAGPGPHHIEGVCANCDSPHVTAKAPLFCSPACRQAAELVRYVRACRRDGRDRLPDIREAIQMRMAMVLGGRYPERARQVRPEVRAEVFRRAGGQCENCGRALDFDRATSDSVAIATIQHVRGSSNDLSNLKAFCQACNTADAQARFVRVEPGSPEASIAANLATRWSSPAPIRLCDDDQHWSSMWQQVARSARELIRERENLGAQSVDDDPSGFLSRTDQGTPIQDC